MFNWIKKETQAQYIARPDHASNDLIWPHPDRSIPRGAKITVRSDEVALFYREGKFVGQILAGTVLLDTANVPFLGSLIDQFTDGNQFITELFFCKTSETQLRLDREKLGQFVDPFGGNLVNLEGGLEYTVSVQNAEMLINKVGGQNIYSNELSINLFDGRVKNIIRTLVGQFATQVNTITDITSGSKTEDFSKALQEKLSEEFSNVGVRLIRVMNLFITLDEESEELVRDFRKETAGAQVATQEGFAEYNLVKGQRQALEGLGAGMATGNSPILMGGGLGGGLGANLTGAPRTSRVSREVNNTRTQRGSGPIRGERKFFYIMDDREQGPVSPRNLALVALSKNVNLSDLQVRSEDDPAGETFAAEYEPLIRDEYNRRKPN